MVNKFSLQNFFARLILWPNVAHIAQAHEV